MKKADYEEMTSAPVPGLVAKLAAPTVFAMLVSVIYNTADTYFVSQLGTSESAAVSVAFSVMTLIQCIGYTLGMGAGSLVSRYLGKKDYVRANQQVSQAVFLGFVLGILFLVFGLTFNSSLMKLLGATDSARPYAAEYSFFIFIAAPIMMVAFIFSNILRNEGKAMLSTIGLVTGGLANLVLDPVFIYAAGMGVMGAGLATMIGQVISFLILGSFFLFGKTVTKVHPKYITKDVKSYLEAFSCGSPTLFRQGFSTTANILLSFLGKPYGDAVVAALGIAAKIYIFIRQMVVGLGQGYMPVLGFNYGAGKYERIRKAFCFTVSFQTLSCLIAMVAVLLFPKELISLFRKDEEVIRIGTIAVRAIALSMPLLGFSTIVNQSLQVIGRSVSASFLASCRQGIIYTPVIFLLHALFGKNGLAFVQPVSDVLTALVSIPFCIYFFRLLKDPEKEKKTNEKPE